MSGDKEKNFDCIQNIKCNQGSIRAVRFNVDGDYILTCGADRTIKLWSWARGVQLANYQGHSAEVSDARGSCDNAQILSGSVDRNVTLWDVETLRISRRWRCHNSSVTCVQFNEESSLAISGSQDNSVKIYDVRSRAQREIQTLNEPTDTVTSLAVSQDTILVGSADGYTRSYDIRNGKLTVDCMGEAVTSVAISRDCASNLVSVADGTCKLIDKSTGQLLASYRGFNEARYYDYKVESCFDNSDRWVIVTSPLGKLFIFDLISENVKETLDLGQSVVSVCCHPQADRIAAASGSSVSIFSSAEVD
ncbi:unnamed protein product [Allacma fusca]|uniref:WD repeat domain-containing protein 83 n=1 Tax=Allacma fusca TaxID=39272 RepID=A0A8J2PH61_9HEXA|nr:unnamed protein product [Allacma fusca]